MFRTMHTPPPAPGYKGEFATEASKLLCEEEYAAGFELPDIA